MNKLPEAHQPSPRLLAEQQAHREWIGGRAATLLSHYWRPDDPVELTAAIGKDWADVLEGLPQAAIARAAIRFQQENPRAKPTPAAIYALALEAIPKPKLVAPAPKEPPAQIDRCSAEAAAEIMAKAGFRPKKFNEGSAE